MQLTTLRTEHQRVSAQVTALTAEKTKLHAQITEETKKATLTQTKLQQLATTAQERVKSLEAQAALSAAAQLQQVTQLSDQHANLLQQKDTELNALRSQVLQTKNQLEAKVMGSGRDKGLMNLRS